MGLMKRLIVGSLWVAILAPIALSSENFELSSSPSVIGIVGQDALLPCQISLGTQPQDMTVQWKKIGDDRVDNVYQFTALTGQETFGQNYQARAVLAKEGIATGNVSLKLKKVQVTDEGIYSCVVKSIHWSADTQTSLHLAALGNVTIKVLEPEDEGIKLSCQATGWFPKPELWWFPSSYQNPQLESKQDHEQLFSVSSTITAYRDTGEITCSAHERSHLQVKKESTIHLSRNVFPHTSAWFPAFWILFMLTLLGTAFAVYCYYKGKRKDSQRESNEEQERLIQESWKKMVESENLDLLRRLERAQTELDFRKARSYLVPIQIDPKCKLPELEVSQDDNIIHPKPTSLEVTAISGGALIVVGTEGIRDGRQYWEVRVGDRLNWELGVMTENIRNKLKEGKLEELQKDQYWSLSRSNGQYHPKEADCEIQKYTSKPQVVGIYLDREENNVMISFYYVKGMNPILKIPVVSSEELYPFFNPGFSDEKDNGKPLIICQNRDWDFPLDLDNNSNDPKLKQDTLPPRKASKRPVSIS